VVERQVQDGEVGCVSYDNVARFEPRVLDLTDLDGDGTREVTFAYRLGCVSDVSPVTVNLVLHSRRGLAAQAQGLGLLQQAAVDCGLARRTDAGQRVLVLPRPQRAPQRLERRDGYVQLHTEP
jgi:hypothetical protein